MFINLKKNVPILKGQYEDFDVYTDMDCFIKSSDGEMFQFLAHVDCFKLLDEQYPESKFILNTRNIYRWVASRIRKFDCSMSLMEKMYNTNNLLNIWTQQWVNHHNNVIDYFKDRDNLLIFDIEKDNGKKIIDFFPELEFKDDIFPKMN